MIITNTSSTTTTDDSTTMIMPEEEISTVSTKLIIRRRSSAMLLGTCSWIDLAIVVDEDNAYYSPSSNKKRRHDVVDIVVDIDTNSTTNTMAAETRWILRPHRYLNLKHNNEITRERPPTKSQSQSQIMIIHPPSTVEPEVINFSWTDLAIIIQD
jgi:hypothetical protein